MIHIIKSTKLFKEFLLLGYMVLTKIFVKERDPREKEIESLLKKSIEEWPIRSLEGQDYLNEAIKIKKDIEREKGQIYFEKYPEIIFEIDETIKRLTEYES